MLRSTARVSPIPTPRYDDDEDVAWALSTAEALYAGGERDEALKWLRRAVEAATLSDGAVRATELAAAAAELASILASGDVAPVYIDDDPDSPSEKTRVGVPAYRANAESSARGAMTIPEPTALHPAQAIRVIVWRTADGVHVAPQGTRVAAISVDAILVALDPSADLASWLVGK